MEPPASKPQPVRDKVVAPLRRPRPGKPAVPAPHAEPIVAGSAVPSRTEQPAPSRPQAVPDVRPPEPIAPVRPLRLEVEPRPAYDVVKRIIDVVIASAVLVLGAPLWLAVALAIKLDSNGPVLFKGTVWGKDCKPFRYYKFRSMRVDGTDDAHRRFIENYVTKNEAHEHDGHRSFKFTGDNRITRIGRFIRKVSIDEIPQLINVLRGDMSIVGPRPPLEYEYELYDDWAKQRLAVLPGLTGYQQVYARHTASFTEKVEMDLAYIRSRSLKLDVRIIFKTIPNAFKGQ